MALHKKTKRAREAAEAAKAAKRMEQVREADGVEVVGVYGQDEADVFGIQGTVAASVAVEERTKTTAKTGKAKTAKSKKGEGEAGTRSESGEALTGTDKGKKAGGKAKGKEKAKPEPLTPEQEARKKLSAVGANIKRLLRNAGKYDGALTYQVEQTATTMMITKKLAEEIMRTTKAVEIETSREGHQRVKISPLYDLYLKFDSANRHNLRALSMNRENMRTADDKLDEGDDAIVTLLKKMNDEEGEE